MSHSPSADDPEVLIQRARDGEAEALGQLLSLYSRYLHLLARLQIRSRLQGKVSPSDLVQETFLEAHRDFAQFQGKTEKELLGWLRRILANNLAACMRHYKTARRDMNLEKNLLEELDRSSQALDPRLLDRQKTPSQLAAHREHTVLLADALDRLPDHYREVLILRHMKSLSFAEIARQLDKREDAVKKLWARALARLQESFGEKT